MRLLLSCLLLVVVVFFGFFLLRPNPPAEPPSPASPPATTQPAQTPGGIPAEVPPTAAPAPPPPKPHILALFEKPVTPAVYELPSGALTTWRKHAAHKPALVVFSNHPFLMPLREEDRQAVGQFVRSAPAPELIRRGRMLVADPLFTSPQTVSAAIEAGLISEVIFVEATKKSVDKLSLPVFQQRAYDAGFLTGDEARAMTLKNGVFSGKLRGLPFRTVHPEKLPKLDKPVLVHIDLGYFDALFVNPVKTPAYPLIYKTMAAIRDAKWPALDITLSFSNQETEFTLEDRYMISTVADTLFHPEMLTGGIPASWELRANAHYAREMFAESKFHELIAQAATESPDDPAAQYDFSLMLFQLKEVEEAFAALDRAAKLDSGYALAYIALADTALGKQDFDKADELWRKAAKTFPDNPFIRISQADLLIRRGRGGEAQKLLRELQQLPWSKDYHPGVPDLLKEMVEAAEK